MLESVIGKDVDVVSKFPFYELKLKERFTGLCLIFMQNLNDVVHSIIKELFIKNTKTKQIKHWLLSKSDQKPLSCVNESDEDRPSQMYDSSVMRNVSRKIEEQENAGVREQNRGGNMLMCELQSIKSKSEGNTDSVRDIPCLAQPRLKRQPNSFISLLSLNNNKRRSLSKRKVDCGKKSFAGRSCNNSVNYSIKSQSNKLKNDIKKKNKAFSYKLKLNNKNNRFRLTNSINLKKVKRTSFTNASYNQKSRTKRNKPGPIHIRQDIQQIFKRIHMRSSIKGRQ